MELKNCLKQIGVVFFILTFMTVCQSDNCIDDPVILDEEYFACCLGRPIYNSELCLEALMKNYTLTQECLVNCIYTEFEVYDGKTIDLAAVKRFLNDKIPDEDFRNSYMVAFQRCSQLNRETIQDKLSFLGVTKSHDCDVYPSFMEYCVWYYTIANCPEKYVSNEESCNIKREWVKECLMES